jgi:hypothetical protein
MKFYPWIQPRSIYFYKDFYMKTHLTYFTKIFIWKHISHILQRFLYENTFHIFYKDFYMKTHLTYFTKIFIWKHMYILLWVRYWSAQSSYISYVALTCGHLHISHKSLLGVNFGLVYWKLNLYIGFYCRKHIQIILCETTIGFMWGI